MAYSVDIHFWKPYWFLYRMLYFVMKSITLEYITFSRILLRIGKRDIGLKFETSKIESPLCMGTILDSFNALGKIP